MCFSSGNSSAKKEKEMHHRSKIRKFKKNLKFEGLKKNLQINISPCQEVNFLKNALSQGWASLMAQLVKNPPAMRETWVQSLGWENPLEKGKATHSSIVAWRIPWTV